MNIHFSSKVYEWETPQDLFDKLNHEFNFDIDVCANSVNKKCKTYFSKKENGLKQDWSGACWMNPPYGKEISKWLKKAYNESLKGACVVCLVPSRTDTKWWHEYCMKGEIRFLDKRIKFVGAKQPAPFASAIVIFYSAGAGKMKILKCPKCKNCFESLTK